MTSSRLVVAVQAPSSSESRLLYDRRAMLVTTISSWALLPHWHLVESSLARSGDVRRWPAASLTLRRDAGPCRDLIEESTQRAHEWHVLRRMEPTPGPICRPIFRPFSCVYTLTLVQAPSAVQCLQALILGRDLSIVPLRERGTKRWFNVARDSNRKDESNPSHGAG